MLIEFTVANYRSIREPQTLSLAAGTGRERLAENTFDTGIPGLPRLVRSAVIYGPNAAGKSNLILAMAFAKDFIVESAKGQENDAIPYAPFRLDPPYRSQPSTFEFIFIQDGVRYQYGFAVDARRVHREWLIAYPERRAQRWFERQWNPGEERNDWTLSPRLKAGRELWRKLTRDNALFLSTAVQLNSPMLRKVFLWFSDKLKVIARPEVSPAFTLGECFGNDKLKARVDEFLMAADVGIAGVSVMEQEVSVDDISGDVADNLPHRVVSEIRAKMAGKTVKFIDARFLHQVPGSDELVSFTPDEESAGTRKLFTLAGPWLDVLDHGLVLVVDELSSSLHPHIVRFLVSTIHDGDANSRNAQLVFSTHDTTLLGDGDVFRRDQVWLVERNSHAVTILYPLLDFSPRKDEAIEKGYLNGRYGAVPFVSPLKMRAADVG